MPEFKDSRPFAPPAHIQFSHAEKDRPEFIREATGATLYLPLIAGAVAFAGTGLLVLALGWSVRWALGAAGMAVLGVGVYWMLDNKSIMATTEIIEGVDPPQQVVPQQPMVTAWSLPKPEGNGLRMGRFDVPADLLEEWCQVAYREGALTFSVWVPKFCAYFKGEGRKRFNDFRQNWIDEGFGEDVKGNRGLVLTDTGWDFCEGALKRRGLLANATPGGPGATPLPAQLESGHAKQAPSIQPHAGTERSAT